MDGIAAIPTLYMCPTAACEAKFRQFDELCVHWLQHPWNRRSELVPVMAGGIRRLSFWQHKRVFVRSLIRGHHVDAASGRPSTAHRRSAAESDYGDIRLLGPCSYFVSPKIVSIEQLHAWEALRPAIK
ncbi:hypothetical protein GGF43_005334 [Coemansia sp. RSA 2618]|nr:hypothetical protein GGF43_005334 [Coemansia sp. RSA 2618]